MKYPVLIEMASENGLWRGFAPDFEKLEAEAGTPELLLTELGEVLAKRLELLHEAGETEPEPMPLECVPMPESFHDWRLALVEPRGGAGIIYPCDLLRVMGSDALILTCNTPSLSFMGESLEDVKQNQGIDRVFVPAMDREKRAELLRGWHKAVKCAQVWAEE